ncbi:MAG: hypothetical protein AAB225_00400 [Acidobacteriota bacterium]
MWRSSCLLAAALSAWAGPVEFGLAEVQRAIAARGLRPNLFRLRTELTMDPPESFRIQPGLVTGGDLRGLMYGLLEAAAQIRETGRLRAASGKPVTPMRGIRYFLHNRDLEEEWYYSRDYWQEYLAMLARNRFNRFNLVFAHQTNYLAPPYPFWLALDEFPEIRAPGLTQLERERNLEMLRFISQTATEHGIDFTLGVWEHNIQPRMTPTTVGLTRENIGPYSYAALRKVLAACSSIRSVQMRTNSESGIPADQQVEFYRDHVFRAIRDAGRRVVLDLRGWILTGGMGEAAKSAGVPLRMSSKYWGEHLGRPYQPAETWPSYSYINFLERPRIYEFYWEVWGLGSHRVLLWGDPDYVRRAVPTFTLSGSVGFEIDPPLAQKGFGNRPGRWGVFTEAAKDRAFWKWEFERHWLFYLLWGRLSYDPKTPDTVWLGELKRRFSTAAPDVLAGYKASSGVLNQIVAAHLADPNMYLWPEVNPGGLIDAYIGVRPSDWRYIAAIPEAVRNRVEGIASAKQTPRETAERLRESAARIEQAVERILGRLDPAPREWRSTEPDFLVLAHLARYHAHKQVAAFELAYFYETGDEAALGAARRELESALGVWEKLARLTDGLYPAEMANGPDDIGHWKDRLPYVRHDLKLIAEREKVFGEFGRFDFGFDFGGPLTPPKSVSYRNDPFVWRNTVEPRFEPVAPGTTFSEAAGYGWLGQGDREAHALPLTPYLEVRAAARNPKQLPENVLYGDWIRGRGRQAFRVRTGDGEFTVHFLEPGGTSTPRKLTARNGHLDIVFPDGEWRVSGLIIKGPKSGQPPQARVTPKPIPRPAITHTPPRKVLAGRPLSLAVSVSPGASAASVRLHYRPLNHLAKFKTLELKSARPVFTIPAEDLSPRWDLMYYFEVLNSAGSGWFQPDPWVATPYYVVPIED